MKPLTVPLAKQKRRSSKMFVAIVPLVVALIGVLMYALASPSKVVEIGRIMFWTGLLVTLFVAAGHSVKL